MVQLDGENYLMRGNLKVIEAAFRLRECMTYIHTTSKVENSAQV